MFGRVHHLSRSYLLVVVVALFFGLAMPKVVNFLAPHSTFLLAAIFFLTGLKINFQEVMGYVRDWRMVLETNILMLLVIPAVVYYLMSILAPALALPFTILAAMPTAMAAPLIAELTGGRQSLALVATVTTSLLAPLTVPLVIYFLVGAQVQVSFGDIFFSLAKVIFIPLTLAEVVKLSWPSLSSQLNKIGSNLSVILLGLIIAAVAGRQAEEILSFWQGSQTLVWLIWLFVLFGLFHLLGYVVIFWRSAQDRFTISLCLTYMNFLLAVYLADNFFPQPAVVVPVILSVVPWTLFLPLSGFIAKKYLQL